MNSAGVPDVCSRSSWAVEDGVVVLGGWVSNKPSIVEEIEPARPIDTLPWWLHGCCAPWVAVSLLPALNAMLPSYVLVACPQYWCDLRLHQSQYLRATSGDIGG